ncbi:Lrp/AsnC family transcriptional regulator [Pseudaestuariivita rosea]|uniref:Lrp/AsnC family transcriptional regulator n=1 Tax=Pseudaestuariivita rosea TaxID=2763263 RepID=UPI001F2B3AF3|nr:Lrp/AsnC family transcriptional regulator [Pseudaestuariivita rosea]
MADLDKYDQQILKILQDDCSVSIDEIAEHVHLSRNACWRRIKQLENTGVIRKRVALLDADALDRGQMVFVLIKTNQHDADWMTKFDQTVRHLPEVVGAYRLTGDLDYVLTVRVADVAAYDRFYKKLIARVPVSEISASFVMEHMKDTTAIPIGT